jgi:hypothetical protein
MLVAMAMMVTTLATTTAPNAARYRCNMGVSLAGVNSYWSNFVSVGLLTPILLLSPSRNHVLQSSNVIIGKVTPLA